MEAAQGFWVQYLAGEYPVMTSENLNWITRKSFLAFLFVAPVAACLSVGATTNKLMAVNDRPAKLEVYRQNSLKNALDEARLSADRLAESLDKLATTDHFCLRPQ